jgi:hypothetical protein
MTPEEIRRLRALLDDTGRHFGEAVEAMAKATIALGNLTVALARLVTQKGEE